MIKVRRKEFDGVVRADGIEIGNQLEFEVPEHIAHFFKELGYEVEMPEFDLSEVELAEGGEEGGDEEVPIVRRRGRPRKNREENEE